MNYLSFRRGPVDVGVHTDRHYQSRVSTSLSDHIFIFSYPLISNHFLQVSILVASVIATTCVTWGRTKTKKTEIKTEISSISIFLIEK